MVSPLSRVKRSGRSAAGSNRTRAGRQPVEPHPAGEPSELEPLPGEAVGAGAEQTDGDREGPAHGLPETAVPTPPIGAGA